MTYGIHDGERVVARFAAPTEVRSNVPVELADALSQRRHSRAAAAQRWEIKSRLELLSHGGNLLMHSLVTKGLSETLDVIVPQNYGVISRRQGSLSAVAVPGGEPKGSSQVLAPAYSGLMPAGTLVRFGDHTKVYVTLADFNGAGPLQIFPPLRQDLAATVLHHGDDVAMLCLYDREVVQGMSYSDGVLSDHEATLVESVPVEASELAPLTATSTVYTVTVDTNGVTVALPTMAAAMPNFGEEKHESFLPVFSSGTLTVTIVYKSFTQEEPEGHLAGIPTFLGGSLGVTINYVNFAQEEPEGHLTGIPTFLGGSLGVTINYVDYSADEAEGHLAELPIFSGGTLADG